MTSSKHAIMRLVRHVSSSLSLPTVSVLAGIGLTVWGLQMVYTPLAVIVPGLGLIGAGIIAALPGGKRW